jgi:hypothetical protein
VGGAGPPSPRQSLIFNICEQALALILEEGRRVGEGLDPATRGEILTLCNRTNSELGRSTFLLIVRASALYRKRSA